MNRGSPPDLVHDATITIRRAAPPSPQAPKCGHVPAWLAHTVHPRQRCRTATPSRVTARQLGLVEPPWVHAPSCLMHDAWWFTRVFSGVYGRVLPGVQPAIQPR